MPELVDVRKLSCFQSSASELKCQIDRGTTIPEVRSFSTVHIEGLNATQRQGRVDTTYLNGEASDFPYQTFKCSIDVTGQHMSCTKPTRTFVPKALERFKRD